MSTLRRFTNDDLPDHFAHQIRDFIRIHWFDIFQYDVHADAIGDDLKPVYFVMVDDPALFSHAAAVTRSVECNGQTYSCGGLSAVLTYPAFRNRGYASQTVQSATEYLNTASLDLALLWTTPDKERFYGRFDWEYNPSIHILVGPQESPEVYEAFTMIRFLSDRSTKNRIDFESHLCRRTFLVNEDWKGIRETVCLWSPPPARVHAVLGTAFYQLRFWFGSYHRR